MPAPEESTTPIDAPATIVLFISGPIARAAIPELCDRVRVLLERSAAHLLVCGVGALVAPDAVTVDALARLMLTARRLGREIRIQDARGELRELLALTGLLDVMPLCTWSAPEPTRDCTGVVTDLSDGHER